LQAKGSNLTIVGPFFERASLDTVLSELAKTIMQTGSQACHAKERDIADYRISLDYFTAQADWSDHFFGTEMDRGKIAEMQAMATKSRGAGAPDHLPRKSKVSSTTAYRSMSGWVGPSDAGRPHCSHRASRQMVASETAKLAALAGFRGQFDAAITSAAFGTSHVGLLQEETPNLVWIGGYP
jgi:hypothetical protein